VKAGVNEGVDSPSPHRSKNWKTKALGIYEPKQGSIATISQPEQATDIHTEEVHQREVGFSVAKAVNIDRGAVDDQRHRLD
jgi:hypothetical protein